MFSFIVIVIVLCAAFYGTKYCRKNEEDQNNSEAKELEEKSKAILPGGNVEEGIESHG